MLYSRKEIMVTCSSERGLARLKALLDFEVEKARPLDSGSVSELSNLAEVACSSFSLLSESDPRYVRYQFRFITSSKAKGRTRLKG